MSDSIGESIVSNLIPLHEAVCRHLSQISQDVHTLAIEKQWWAEPRSDIGLLTLIQSELNGEAVDGLRDGSMSDKIRQFCAVEEELADSVIRILDMCAARSIKPWELMPQIEMKISDRESFADTLDVYTQSLTVPGFFPRDKLDMLGAAGSIIGLHIWALAHSSLLEPNCPYKDSEGMLARCLTYIFYIQQLTGWRIGEAIVAKHEYNHGRSARHGGKVY